MKLLRRVLLLQAGVWAACGLALAALPRWVLVDLFDQVHYPDYAYVRVAGISSFVLAMLMYLTAVRGDEFWWFTWAFVIASVGAFAVAVANALGGRADGSAAALWWIFAATSLAFTVGLLAGLAKTGTERPPI